MTDNQLVFINNLGALAFTAFICWLFHDPWFLLLLFVVSFFFLWLASTNQNKKTKKTKMHEWSTFPPKPGLTEKEQRKVRAFIKKGKMKICPPMGSPELAELGKLRDWKWANSLSKAMRIKLGMNPLKKR